MTNDRVTPHEVIAIQALSLGMLLTAGKCVAILFKIDPFNLCNMPWILPIGLCIISIVAMFILAIITVAKEQKDDTQRTT